MRRGSVFRSAITGDDGEVDAGYLGLYVVTAIVLGAIPSAILLAAVRMFLTPDHALDLVGIAAVIGAAGTCYGVAAGGVGLFRMGDKPRPGTATTTVQQVVTSPKEA